MWWEFTWFLNLPSVWTDTYPEPQHARYRAGDGPAVTQIRNYIASPSPVEPQRGLRPKSCTHVCTKTHRLTQTTGLNSGARSCLAWIGPSARTKCVCPHSAQLTGGFFYEKLPLWDVNQFFSPFPALMTQCSSNQLQALKTHFPERAEHTKMFGWGDPFTYLPNLCLLRNQRPTFSAKHKSSKQGIGKWLKMSWQ